MCIVYLSILFVRKTFSFSKTSFISAILTHGVYVTLIFIKVVRSKCKKHEISLKVLKIFFKTMLAESLRVMSERHLITVAHIWRHCPSSVPVLSKMAEMKFTLLKLNVSFRRNKIDNQTTYIFTNYYSNTSTHKYFFNVVPVWATTNLKS